MANQLVLTIETVTPLFIGGAEAGKLAETVREASIRGQLRYWLRALLGRRAGADHQELARLEGNVMGSTGAGSPVRLRVRELPQKRLATASRRVLPHSNRRTFQVDAFAEGQMFHLEISPRPGLSRLPTEFVAALLLWLNLGGVGKRSRRGHGSLRLVGVQASDGLLPDGALELLKAHPADGDALFAHVEKVVDWCAKQVPLTAPPTERPPYPILAPEYASVLVCTDGLPPGQGPSYQEPMKRFWNDVLRNNTKKLADDKAYGHARDGRRASPFHLHMTRTDEGYHFVLTTFWAEPSPKGDAGWNKVERLLAETSRLWDGRTVWGKEFSQMSEYEPRDFVLFTIGPVQSFIAEARRTQDLWAGSRLLSQLMRAALEAVEADAELVYPLRAEDGEWPDGLPNRAVLLTAPGQGTAVGQHLEDAARDEWKSIAGRVAEWLNDVAPDAGWWSIWNRQLDQWLETYWVVMSWNGHPDSYGDVYREASDLLTARKRLRHFPATREPDVKCTLCGVRQALRGGDNWSARRFWDQGIRVHKRTPLSAVRPGERLCAVDAVKRFAQHVGELKGERFPSTSSVAATSFRLAVLNNWAACRDAALALLKAIDRVNSKLQFSTPEPVECLRQAAEDKDAERFLRYDGDFFYRDFYTDARLAELLNKDEKDVTDAEKEAFADAAKALNRLLAVCREHGIQRPSAYYAVLALDGDRMGRTIAEKIHSPDQHQALSRKMAAFAAETARQIIEKDHPGALVYSGGDDALALLPVDDALETADELRRELTAQLSDDEQWGTVTASAGLVVVHHQAPLQTAVRTAHEAQERAKASQRFQGYDRQAIAVEVLRRSGEPRAMGARWLVDGEAILTQVDLVRELMAADALSSKFAYEVQSEAAALDQPALPDEARQVELARLVKRHSEEKTWPANVGKHKVPDRDRLGHRLAGIGQKLPAVDGQSGMDQLGNWLLLAQFLAKGGRE